MKSREGTMVVMSASRGEIIKETYKAFQKYYWESRQVHYSGLPGAYIQKVSKKDAGAPFIDLALYVVNAWKAKVERSEACYYGGTKLLFSVLQRTNRRWAPSVEEANNLFMAGKKTSEYLWDLLEKHGDNKDFWKEIDHLTRELQKLFEGVSQ